MINIRNNTELDRMPITIMMRFTRDGEPATDIHTATPGFPTITIHDIGADSTIVDDVAMTPGNGINDGLYKYDFTEGNGFDNTKSYKCTFDGGISITLNTERYLDGTIEPNHDNELLTGQSTIESKIDTIDTEVGIIDGKIDTINTDVDDVLTATTYLRKFESNRTQVDVTTGELIVYDDDCSTILWKFRLLDENGQPDVQSIAERLPITGGAAPWNTCA